MITLCSLNWFTIFSFYELITTAEAYNICTCTVVSRIENSKITLKFSCFLHTFQHFKKERKMMKILNYQRGLIKNHLAVS